MPEKIIEYESGQEIPLPADQKLRVIDYNEAALLYSGKSLDLKTYQPKRHLPIVFAQDAFNSVVQFVDSAATYSTLAGREMDYDRGGPSLTDKEVEEYAQGAPIRLLGVWKIGQIEPMDVPEDWKRSNQPKPSPSMLTKVGEKMRNFAIAIRQKAGTADLEPQNMGEKIASVAGQSTGSLINMIGGALAGGGIATVTAGPEAFPVGAAVGAFGASFVAEKAIMAQTLLDSGYGEKYAQDASNYYASMVAPLDLASGGYLLKLARPLVTQAVKSTVGKSLVKAALTKSGQIVLKGLEGQVVEGGTEAIQNEIQRQFEIALAGRKPDFQKDLSDAVAVFIGAGFIGGTAGAYGQITMRRQHVADLSQKFPEIPRDTIAQIYDESVLRSNDMFYDELIQQTNVQPQMEGINKAFAKIDGKATGTFAEQVEEPLTAAGFAATADLIDAEGTLVDAKTLQLRSDVQTLIKQRDQVNRQLVTEAQAETGRTQEEIDRSKARLSEVNARLEQAQVEYQTVLAGNPKLQALEQKLADVRMELSQKDPVEQAAYEQAMEEYMAEEPGGGNVYSFILQEGGIAPYKKGQLKEEYREGIPLRLRNKSGLALDEMADALRERYPQLGVTDEASLLEMLDREKMRRQNEPGSPTPGTPEEIQKLRDRAMALETKIQGIKSPEEMVAVAEQKVEKIQGALVKTFGQLLELEVISEAQKANPDELIAVKKERSALQKKAEFLTEQVLAAAAQAEAIRQGYEQVSGRVSLNASQVRQMAKTELRNVLQAYKAGVKLTQQSFKTIQKSFLELLGDIKFSNKAKTRLLRKVLTIRSATQFNAKIGDIVDGINTIIRGDIVQDVQKLGKKVLDRMMPDRQQVAPKAQVFAEHLQRVFKEDVPLIHDPESSDTTELAKAMVEQAVYDLKNAGDNVGAAKRAFRVIQGYFQDQLQVYEDFKARADATYARLNKQLMELVSGGVPVDALKESFDAVRQQAERGGILRSLPLTPYTISFMSILDMIDKNSGQPTMKGPMVREFGSKGPYQAWIVHTDWAKTQIDGGIREIYGPKGSAVWAGFIGSDFLNIPFKIGEEERIINIPRGAAMSLYLMTKMPLVRQDLLSVGVDEAWLEAFERGENVNFTEQDYAWMRKVRETLDAYAEKIAPIYERLTGKPFRLVNEYFMIMRYMNRPLDEGGVTDAVPIIDTMLNGDFGAMSVADSNRFKQRTRSKQYLQIPDIYQAISRYALDMNHFLAYADYVVKLQKTFQSDEAKNLMATRLPPGITTVIKEYTDTLAGGGTRSIDRQAMAGFFTVLGWYARNQIMSPKNMPRQFSGVAAFTQYEGMGAYELTLAALDLPRAHEAGELKSLLDTSYMRQRYEGMYEFAVQYAKDIAHAEHFSALRGKGFLGKFRRGVTSETFNRFMTFSARYGDRWASVVGGWAMYQKVLKETGNINAALAAATDAIDNTQQSLDPGKLPVAFQKTDLPNRLLTIFRRTPAIYLDTYLRGWKAYASGRFGDKGAKRMTSAQFGRMMLTYHLWVPLFEVAVTSLAAPDDMKDEVLLAGLAGPFTMHVIFGQLASALLATIIKSATDGEADFPAYLSDPSDSTLLISAAREGIKTYRAIMDAFEYADVEAMWDVVTATGGVLDLTPVPAGWATQSARGVYDMFQGEPWMGFKEILGYPESRTKEK